MANAMRAESWCILEKPSQPNKPKKKRAKRRKPRQPRNVRPLNPLPPAIDVQPAAPASAPEPESLTSKISSLFSAPKVSAPAASSSSFATYGSGDPLTPESEQLLASVPDSIGHTDDQGGPERLTIHDVGPADDDPIAALMAQVAFEEQDVRDTMEEFFDRLSERYKSEHWKLSDRQSRMLGRPASQMLNAVWIKLQVYLPSIIGRWCEETPGASAFILACGFVIVPKVTKQIKLSRERKSTAPVRGSGPQPVPAAPAQPKQGGGMIWSEATEAR